MRTTLHGRAVRRRRRVALMVAILALGLAALAALRSGSDDKITGGAAARGSTVLRYEISSREVGRTLAQTAVTPPGDGKGRPLLVFLHGRGSDRQEQNANAAFFEALAALGRRAPNVVFPDGEDHSYFHDRRSGAWAKYVLDEVIPQAVRRLGADSTRVAIGGISMGGFGAFAIARGRPEAFCAVGGHSAALWEHGGESAPGAFDDAEDFTRNDLIALARTQGRGAWGDARLWLDGGLDDPFRAAGERFAASLGIRMRHWPGAHENGYWRSHYGAYLRFYADALARC